MNRILELTIVLCFSMMMLWISLVYLIVGKTIYGSDATLLFAMGMIFFMGFNGLLNLLREMWK